MCDRTRSDLTKMVNRKNTLEINKHEASKVKLSGQLRFFRFNHKALAKVFRAKMLDGITQAGFTLEQGITDKWILDCKQVGSGTKAIVYLGRYL